MNFYKKYIKENLRARISFYLTIGFIFMSVFILFITQNYSKSNLYKISEKNYSLSVKSERDLYDSHIIEKRRLLDDFIKQTEWYLAREGNNINPSSWFLDYSILDNLKFFQNNNSRYFEQVFLVTPDLKMYTYSDLFQIDLPVEITQRQYEAAEKNDLSIISQGRISRYSGDPIFTIAKGVKYNQKNIGVIGATLNLKELSKELSEKSTNTQGDFYVVRDGKYIIHKDPAMILTDSNFDFSFLENDSGQEVLKNETYFYLKTKEIPDGWLVSKIEHKNLYGDIDKLMLVLFLLLMTFLAGFILISYMTAKSITDPVISLKEAMDKAREGDFFAWAEKKTSDELGKAADSFNYLMERIRTLTFFDSLTNLPNYEQFKYWFAQSAKERDLSEKSYSFVLLSVNGFKKVNEAYGVEAGDQILIQVAGRLKNFKKRVSALLYVSRFSGDEFLLFYKDIENKNILEQEILSLLKNLNAPYLYKGNNIYIRFVAGGAFCEECYKNLDVQMSAASNARSIAKKEGRDYFIVGNKDNILNNLVELKNLENDLHTALEKGHLEVYYQPLYNVEKEDYLCTEALLRYNHPEKGLILPMEFIPLAEEIGITDKIGEFVLEQSIKDMKNLEKLGYKKLDIHVNISPAHINKNDFTQNIISIAKKHNFSPRRIWLEITEDVALFNLQQQEQKFQVLKENGVKISIDDFGTGYSSFLYLKQLSADQIKIDKSFVINMKTNKRDLEIIKTITTLAKSLNIDLVTEGVEDQDSFEILKDLGVRKMQGYHFARPMDISALERFFAGYKK